MNGRRHPVLRSHRTAVSSIETLSPDNSRVEDAFSIVMMSSPSNRRHRQSRFYNEGVHCARRTWRSQANYQTSRDGRKFLRLLLPRQRLSTAATSYSYR